MAVVVELVSPLTREECVRRLREGVDTRSWRFRCKRPVTGCVSETGIEVWRCEDGDSSTWASLQATLEQEGHQTRIRCRFEVPRYTFIVIIVIWFYLALSMLGGCSFRGLLSVVTGEVPVDSTGVTFASVMFVIGCGVIVMTHFTLRSERAFLLDFLRETIGARPASD